MEINHFIEDCWSCAKFYVNRKRKRLEKYLLNGSVQIEDIALNAIVPLFLSNEDHFNVLKTSFQNWKPVITTETDAGFFLNRIIENRVEQQIIVTLKEMDPFFSKIQDSIIYLIRKNGCKKISYFETNYIIPANFNTTCYQFINSDDFYSIPASYFGLSNSLLPNLFEYLIVNYQCSPAIPYNLLVKKIKEMVLSDYCTFENNYCLQNRNSVVEIVEKGLTNALNKLDKSYYRKNKISKNEAEVIGNALKDIAEDLKSGGINHGLYDYISCHMDISRNTYQEKYNNIFEYLVKTVKISIAKQLV